MTNKIKISPDAFQEWKVHPITQVILKHFEEIHSQKSSTVLSALYNINSTEAIGLRVAELMGRNRVLETVLDLDILKQDVLDPYIEWKEE